METQTYRTDLWTQFGRRGWDELREQHGNTHTTTGKTESSWEAAL